MKSQIHNLYIVNKLSITDTAKALGITRHTTQKLIKQYGFQLRTLSTSRSIKSELNQTEIDYILANVMSDSIPTIAKHLNIPYGRIYRYIKANNIDKGSKHKTSSKQLLSDKHTILKITRDELHELYHIQGMNMYEIASKMNVSTASVCNAMKRYDIKARTKSEIQTERMKDPKVIEHLRQTSSNSLLRNRYQHTWIEVAFEKWCDEHQIDYDGQFQIENGGHRYDFLIGDKILVECDGIYWHNTPIQIEKDRSFERLAIVNGYQLFRFTDAEIKQSNSECFNSLLEVISCQ